MLLLLIAQQGYWQDASQGDFLGGREAYFYADTFREAALGVNFWASGAGLRLVGQDYDFNDDGATDLAVFGAGASDARIVYGPSFTSDTRFYTNWAEGMATADLNANGIPEVIVGEQSSTNSYIYWDMSSTYQSLGFGRSCYGVAVGDLNSDGSLDLVLAGYGTQNSIFWGPNYTSRTDFGLSSGDHWDPFVADVNLDGAADVVVAEAGSGLQLWWGPDFSSYQTLSAASVKATSVADLNADGWPDILGASYSTGGGVYIFWGPDFSSQDFLSLDNLQDLEVGDLDGDGNLDVAACGNFSGVTRVWWGPDFTSYTDLAASTGDGVDLLDFDNDGDLDVANSYGSDAVRIYANQGSRNFTLWTTVSLAGWDGAYADLRKYEEPGSAYDRRPVFNYISRTFTGSSNYILDSVRWWAQVPAGVSLRLYVRASDDSASWTPWKEVSNGGAITDPDFWCRKFYQYRVEVETDLRNTNLFSLDSVRLYWYDCAYGVNEERPRDYIELRGPVALINSPDRARALRLFDASGRLVREWRLSEGFHRVRWAEGLPKGVYVLSLEGLKSVKGVVR